MTCQELVERLTDYLEGALDPELAAQVTVHLSICEPCALYLDQLHAVIRVAGRTDTVELPRDVLDSFLTLFRADRGA